MNIMAGMAGHQRSRPQRILAVSGERWRGIKPRDALRAVADWGSLVFSLNAENGTLANHMLLTVQG